MEGSKRKDEKISEGLKLKCRLRRRGRWMKNCALYKYGARCWWLSWLRHRATNRNIAGSIPDGVTGIFH